MNKLLTLIAMFAALCTMSTLAQKSPKPDPWKQAGADDSLRKAFEQAIYSLKDSGHGTGTETWTGTNDAQRLSMEFDAHEARLTHPQGSVGFHLSGYGYGDKLKTPTAPKLAGDGSRLEYRRGDFTEWYVNGRQGLEQGFTLAKKPTGGSKGQPLTIALGVTGTLALSQQDGAVVLKSGKSTVLRYGGLSARDALGRTISARTEARNNEIRIVVEDQRAQYPLTVDPTWAQEQELTASDGAADDSFGVAVAVSGTTVVIGATGHQVGDNAGQGAAYVFVLSGSTWIQQQELTASDGAANDNFGVSVAVSGTTAVIGATKNTVGGAAYVFVQNGSRWTQQQELTAPGGDSGGAFGSSVAVSGTTAVIGDWRASQVETINVGSAYVFVQNGNKWTQEQELMGLDHFGAATCEFGYSVAASGATAVIGAPCQNVLETPNQGAAYVFVRSGGTWTQQAELTASDGATGDAFGTSVAVSGTTAVVGATGPIEQDIVPYPGAAYIYVQSGTTWTQQQELTPADGYFYDRFGGSVAVSGTTAVIGATGHSDQGIFGYQGAAYIYVQSGETWTLQAEPEAADGALDDAFGSSVAVSGTTAVIGADNHQVAGNKIQGAAYVFVGPPLAALTTPTPGSTLTSTGVEFTWSAVSGASAYDLHLSAVAPGGYDLYLSGHIAGTSTTATNLPINGGTIYARLYTIIGGVTYYNDYTYTAMSATLAHMIYPAPGSTITTSKVWFDWTPGTGVTQYDLHLSAVAPGGYDLDASGPITRTYKTVFSIPLNGETIYARLYSIIDGEKRYIDYTYKAQ